MPRDLEDLARISVDCGFQLHEALGPGLLGSVYEACLFQSLAARGLRVERQLLIELKSTENHAPVHAKQVITYLRLMDLPLGLLMNFGCATFKEGARRIANNYYAPRP